MNHYATAARWRVVRGWRHEGPGARLRRYQTTSEDGSGVTHYQVKDLQGRGGRYRGRCPVHQGEGCDAFHVDVKRKIFHCFSCGAGGDVLELVALLNRCTLREAAGQLKAWFPEAATCGAAFPSQRVRKERWASIHR